MNKEKFTIKDLKTGHIVQMRDGDTYVFFKDESVCSLESNVLCPLGSATSFSSIEKDRDTFKCSVSETWDIVKVYEVRRTGTVETYRRLVDILSCSGKHELKRKLELETDVVWEEEAKKLTVAEVSRLLGYTVEIVEG